MLVYWYKSFSTFERLVPSAHERKGERVEEILLCLDCLGRGVEGRREVESERCDQAVSSVQ